MGKFSRRGGLWDLEKGEWGGKKKKGRGSAKNILKELHMLLPLSQAAETSGGYPPDLPNVPTYTES